MKNDFLHEVDGYTVIAKEWRMGGGEGAHWGSACCLWVEYQHTQFMVDMTTWQVTFSCHGHG